MKKFSIFLKEGIIRIPESAVTPIMNKFCSVFYSQIDPDRYETFRARFREVAEELYGPFVEGFSSVRMTVKIPEYDFYDRIMVFFGDNLPEDTGAGVTTDGRELHINLYDSGFVQRINMPQQNGANVRFALALKESAVKHELAHLVQMYIGDHRQLKLKAGYRTDKDDYSTSPVEMEPTIISLVDKFRDMVKMQSVYFNPITEEQAKEYMRTLMGAASISDVDVPSMFANNKHSHFFADALKRIAPTKFKKAMKKFVTEVIRTVIPQMKEEGHII